MSQTISTDRLPTSGAAPATAGAPNSLEQMKTLAAQFESVLIGQMMKQMRESLFSENDEDGKASGFSGGPLADQVYSELSAAISRAGGIGVGDALSGALARQAQALGGAPGALGAAPGTAPVVTPAPVASPGKDGAGRSGGPEGPPCEGMMTSGTMA